MYQTAGGTATAITLTMQTLVNGYFKTFIASANNSGAATTINGKKLYKPGTTTAPNLIAGKAYTVWYNSTGDIGNGCFFIKASAEGTALASDVRNTKTFSNDNDIGMQGGLDLSLLVSGNIRAGITIDGVTGKSTVVDTTISTSMATAAMIRNGYKCYINGVLTTGIAPEKAAATITPTTTDQTITSGVITTGIQTIKGDANLVPSNIVSGKNIFGIDGTAIGSLKYISGTIGVNSTVNLGFTIVALYSNAGGSLGFSGNSDGANLSNYWCMDIRFSGTSIEAFGSNGSVYHSSTNGYYIGGNLTNCFVKITGNTSITNTHATIPYVYYAIGY